MEKVIFHMLIHSPSTRAQAALKAWRSSHIVHWSVGDPNTHVPRLRHQEAAMKRRTNSPTQAL